TKRTLTRFPASRHLLDLSALARCRFRHFTPCTEISWRLAAEFWGHGYATEAATAALKFGFETVGLSEIVAFAGPANLRSRRVMDRIGMVRDPNDDFDHPGLPGGHLLRRHVLYRKRRPPAPGLQSAADHSL